jgi:hypothetical protein
MARLEGSVKTMSQSWIADRLNMRSAANVSQQVRRFEGELKVQGDSRIKEASFPTEPSAQIKGLALGDGGWKFSVDPGEYVASTYIISQTRSRLQPAICKTFATGK